MSKATVHTAASYPFTADVAVAQTREEHAVANRQAATHSMRYPKPIGIHWYVISDYVLSMIAWAAFYLLRKKCFVVIRQVKLALDIIY